MANRQTRLILILLVISGCLTLSSCASLGDRPSAAVLEVDSGLRVATTQLLDPRCLFKKSIPLEYRLARPNYQIAIEIVDFDIRILTASDDKIEVSIKGLTSTAPKEGHSLRIDKNTDSFTLLISSNEKELGQETFRVKQESCIAF